MKLILVLGTSLSAAGLAAGFAMFANQALSRETPATDTTLSRPILPARVAPDLSADLIPVARAQAARLAPVRADGPRIAHAVTSGNAVLPVAPAATPSPAAVPAPSVAPDQLSAALFAASAQLAERPPRRPLQVAYSDPLPSSGMVAAEFAPIPAERFENLPLIGVYR